MFSPLGCFKALTLFLLFIGTSLPAFGSEVWFSPQAPFPVPVSGPKGSQDYLDLFKPDALWKNAAAGVKVFKMSTQAVHIAPDDVLAGILADLKSRNIEFAIEGLMLSTGAEGCGRGIEGYTGPDDLAFDAAKIKRLGGTLSAVAMDEPLWFGRFDNSPAACHSSVDEIAANVAKTVASIRAVFPDVRIGDIEPATSFKDAEFTTVMQQWTDAFAKATGQRLAFFDADLDWSNPWQKRLQDFAALLKPRQIPFGVIYDGDPDDSSDQAWTVHAQDRFVTVENDLAIQPDRAIIQSWMTHPAHNMPDTQAGTLSNLVVQYLKPAPGMTLSRSANGIEGRLTDGAGNPVAGTVISASMSDPSGPGLYSGASLTYIVPDNAAHAIIALRINNECDCSGSADIALGNLTFEESGQTSVSIPAGQLLGAGTESNPAGPLAVLKVAQGQPVQKGSQQFPVTPGASYSLTFPARISAASAGSGYLAVIFLDRSGKEVRRDKFPLQTGEVPLRQIQTDGNGKFYVTLPAGISPTALAIMAHFAGNDKLRPARASLR